MSKIKRYCLTCKKEFSIYPCRIKRGRGKFCSQKCKGMGFNTKGKNHPRWKGGKITKDCLICKEKFLSKPSEEARFCSNECVGIWQHENLSGKNSPHWRGGEIVKKCLLCNCEYKLKLCQETIRKFCSRECRGAWMSKNNIKEKSPNWKGGVTPINEKIRKSIEYRQWRKSVFERDNYACVLCGIKNGGGKAIILNADHIKPFSLFIELRFDINNGRTLCINCHQGTDSYLNPKIRKEDYLND